MTLHWLDHVLFIALVAVFPWIDRRRIHRTRDAIRAGRSELRPAFFRTVIWQEWAMVAVLLAMWFGLGRTFAGLTTVPTSALWIWIGLALAVVVCVTLLIEWRRVATNPERRDKARKELEPTDYLIARTPQERRLWTLVSITAGICEEVFYRGYVFAYLIALTGWPLWAVVGLSSVAFGLAHAYQGPQGVVRTGTVGLILGAIYGMTGSLLLPVLLHAAIDLISGRIGELVVDGDEPGLDSPDRQVA